jgi:hypothetical protein
LLLRIDGGKLTRYAVSPISAWSQGAAFARRQDAAGAEHGGGGDPGAAAPRRQVTDTGQRIKVDGGPGDQDGLVK